MPDTSISWGLKHLYNTWARKKVPQFQSVIDDLYAKATAYNDAQLVPVGAAWELPRNMSQSYKTSDMYGETIYLMHVDSLDAAFCSKIAAENSVIPLIGQIFRERAGYRSFHPGSQWNLPLQ